MNDQPSSRARWGLRFSLRSLVVLTAVVGAFFGGRASRDAAMREVNVSAQIQVEAAKTQLAAANAKVVQIEQKLRDVNAARMAERLSNKWELGRPQLLNPPAARRQFGSP